MTNGKQALTTVAIVFVALALLKFGATKAPTTIGKVRGFLI